MNIILLMIAFSFIVVSTASGEFLVKTIYFKTHEAPDIELDKYQEIFRDIQSFFRKEMLKHGYGAKTIQFETDNFGLVKIHTIEARHQPEFYSGEVFRAFYNKISKEIPFHLNSATNREEQDNHYIIILGGIPIVNDGLGSPLGGAWTFGGGAIGGTCVVNKNYENDMPDYYQSLIIHELSHTFHLYHNQRPQTIMGPLPFGFPEYITKSEASMLNRMHAFNVNVHHITNTRPTIVSTEIIDAKRDNITMEVSLKSNSELYFVQLSYYQDYVASQKVKGDMTIATLDISRAVFRGANPIPQLLITAMDINGNVNTRRFHNISIPVEEPIEEPVEEPVEEQMCTDCDIDHSGAVDDPLTVYPTRYQLTTKWATLKQ